MRVKILILFCFLWLFCHKDIMIQHGYTEIKDFEWKVIEEENKLNIKYWIIDSPVDTITTATVKIKVEGIDLENTFNNPTVKLDSDDKSLHVGAKCIEESWIPAITITKTNIEEIRFYVK